MSKGKIGDLGRIAWTDLTVPNAASIRDFYIALTGWEPAEVDMGSYADYAMNLPGGGSTVAGICHRRGVNADLPAQWLVYILVKDLDQKTSRCKEMGGKVLAGPKDMGELGRYCVIQDPAGAVAALFERSLPTGSSDE